MDASLCARERVALQSRYMEKRILIELRKQITLSPLRSPSAPRLLTLAHARMLSPRQTRRPKRRFVAKINSNDYFRLILQFLQIITFVAKHNLAICLDVGLIRNINFSIYTQTHSPLTNSHTNAYMATAHITAETALITLLKQFIGTQLSWLNSMGLYSPFFLSINGCV
jgi:hypothetical protein